MVKGACGLRRAGFASTAVTVKVAALQRLLEVFGFRARADIEPLDLLAVGADQPRLEGIAARRGERRDQRPVFPGNELLDFELAVADQPQRDRLHAGEAFDARLVGADGKKIQRIDIGSGAEAEDFRKAIETSASTVTTVDAKPARRNPQAPFTTSTLQQEASRKLGFAPAHTMRIAQRLYEGIDIGGETTGLITYMRTDGVQIDPSAITQTRKVIGEDYGNAYVPDAPRQYQAKAKNAQEAHEAIRPTDLSRRPDAMRRRLDNDQARLYELIWKRTIASQMKSADSNAPRSISLPKPAHACWSCAPPARSSSSTVSSRSTRKAMTTTRTKDSRRLPAMSAGEPLKRQGLAVTQHFTEPPPRFSEASLVKRMEELGIGRPSTYASILQVLKDRGYVKLEKKRLHGEDKGRVVVAFLENFFRRYVEYDFTADLEEQLDRISNNEFSWQQVLKDFWRDFIGAVDDIKDIRVAEVLDVLDNMLGPHIYPVRADGGDVRQCPTCGTGKLNLKAGKFGAFVGCSNYPECRYTRPLAADNAESADRLLGQDPETGRDVNVKAGRFGPYIQLGEQKDYGEDEKPKRAGIPKGVSPSDIELERALKLLSLPREIGKHPESGLPITAGIGRFGPFVKHDKTYASLEAGDEVFDIGLNRAVTLIGRKSPKARATAASAPIRENSLAITPRSARSRSRAAATAPMSPRAASMRRSRATRTRIRSRFPKRSR